MNVLTTAQQSKLQKVLITYLDEAKKRNSSFGLRALARRVDLSPGALSEIMSGKRRVSPDVTKKILDRLLVNPVEVQSIFESHEEEVSPIQLSLDQYQVLAEWQYLAILNLIETKNFKNDPKYIARRLGLGLDVVKTALERLFRLEMIEESRGKLKRTQVRYKTSEDLQNLAIRKFHTNALHKAEEALLNVPVDEREFTAMILPADPKKLKQVKEKIRRFREKLLKEFEGDETEVFQVSIQVFPLTKKNEFEGDEI
ncbi:MAG: TIGR02147 family protein [Bacteriovoracaceae bacterium]